MNCEGAILGEQDAADRIGEIVALRVEAKLIPMFDVRLAKMVDEMKAANKEAREVVIEAVTGFRYEDRHKVRNAVQWAYSSMHTITRWKIMVIAAVGGIAAKAFWTDIFGKGG